MDHVVLRQGRPHLTPMITVLVFIAAIGILARLSWPKSAYVPPRETVTSIIGGAILRVALIFAVAGIVLVLLAAMT